MRTPKFGNRTKANVDWAMVAHRQSQMTEEDNRIKSVSQLLSLCTHTQTRSTFNHTHLHTIHFSVPVSSCELGSKLQRSKGKGKSLNGTHKNRQVIICGVVTGRKVGGSRFPGLL